LIYEYATGEIDGTDKRLEMLFKPLNNSTYNTPSLMYSKALVTKKIYREPLLRIYAIRIDANCYVITGGAIKLTDKMAEHPDTEKELMKISQCKSFLIQNGINIEDDLMYYYEEQQ
jgi:hypothetical protein